MAHPLLIIQEAAQETGWNEDSQIRVLCDFIEQMNRVQPNFQTYVQKRVDEEHELTNHDSWTEDDE